VRAIENLDGLRSMLAILSMNY